MKIPFYILGLLLQYGPQHGYSLKQIIEERIADFANIKLPTIYYHLNKLNEKGYVTETLDKDGNRPEKTVYHITEKGKEHFDKLFEKLLNEKISWEFALDGILYFGEHIHSDQLKNELNRKKQETIKIINNVKMHKEDTVDKIPERGKYNAEMIFDHHLFHLEAELNWIEKVIKGL